MMSSYHDQMAQFVNVLFNFKGIINKNCYPYKDLQSDLKLLNN